MKKKSKLPVLVFIIGVLAFASCQKDETVNSSLSDRDKFVSRWKAQDISQRYGSTSYEIRIKIDSNSTNGIIIENLYQFSYSFKTKAIVNGNYFDIPLQPISGNIIDGSGFMQSLTLINMKYSVNSGGTIDTVSSNLIKL